MESNGYTLYILIIFSSFIPSRAIIEQTEIACNRQPYKTLCADGRRSQYTLRWHAMGQSCITYPYGYCPENEISHVVLTMRTKKSCEDLCFDRQSGNGESTSRATVIRTQSIETAKASISRKIIPDSFNYTCKKLPYKRLCTKNIPSQFTFRWYYSKGVCLAYPYGHCSEEYDNFNVTISLRTREACELLCRNQSNQEDHQNVVEFNKNADENLENSNFTIAENFPTLPNWPPDTVYSASDRMTTTNSATLFDIYKSYSNSSLLPTTLWYKEKSYQTLVNNVSDLIEANSTISIDYYIDPDIVDTMTSGQSSHTMTSSQSSHTMTSGQSSHTMTSSQSSHTMTSDQSSQSSTISTTRISQEFNLKPNVQRTIVKNQEPSDEAMIQVLMHLLPESNGRTVATTKTTTNGQQSSTTTLTSGQVEEMNVFKLFTKWFNNTIQSNYFSRNNNSVTPTLKENRNSAFDNGDSLSAQKQTFVETVLQKVCAVIDCGDRTKIFQRKKQ